MTESVKHTQHRSAAPVHLSPVQTFHYSHLAVPVVFALRLIENRKSSCDDQTQLLRKFNRKPLFQGTICNKSRSESQYNNQGEHRTRASR